MKSNKLRELLLEARIVAHAPGAADHYRSIVENRLVELVLENVYEVLRREELNGVVGFQQRATVDHLINSIQQHFYKD